MALLTSVVDIQDANGNSFVPPDVDGTKPLKIIRLSSDIAASYAKSGDLGIVTLSVAPGAGGNVATATLNQQVLIAKLAYVQQTSPGTTQFTAALGENRTGASISIPGVRLIPYGNVAQDATNYLSIVLYVANLNLSSPTLLCGVSTQTGDPNGLNQTITGGTPIDLKGLPGPTTGPFSVPNNKVVLVDIQFFGGSAPTCPQFSIVPHM